MSHKYSCDFYGTHMGCVYCHACFPVATMVRHPSSAHTEGSDSRTPARSLMPLVTHSTLIVTTRQPGTRVPLTVTPPQPIINSTRHSSLITHHEEGPHPSVAGPAHQRQAPAHQRQTPAHQRQAPAHQRKATTTDLRPGEGRRAPQCQTTQWRAARLLCSGHLAMATHAQPRL